MRNVVLALLAAAALLAPRELPAASLQLPDGAVLRVMAISQPTGGAHSAVGAPRSLLYTVTEADGRTWAGSVPGSEGASPADVSLARNPMTGDVVMAFARPGNGGRDLVTSTWLGQAWSDPAILSSSPVDESSPMLAFRPGGDALIAFTSRTPIGTESLLLRHFELGAEIQTYSFVDAGQIRQLLGDATTSSEPRLLGLVGGTDSLAAYLLIGGADRTPLSVVRVALDSILDSGGFGAAPVPVSFIRSSAQSGTSSNGITGRAGESGAVGEILAPWRMVMGGGEAIYWVDAGRVLLVTFSGDAMGRLVSFDVPATDALLHVEAYRVARAELGVGGRRLSGSDLPAGIRRIR